MTQHLHPQPTKLLRLTLEYGCDSGGEDFAFFWTLKNGIWKSGIFALWTERIKFEQGI